MNSDVEEQPSRTGHPRAQITSVATVMDAEVGPCEDYFQIRVVRFKRQDSDESLVTWEEFAYIVRGHAVPRQVFLDALEMAKHACPRSRSSQPPQIRDLDVAEALTSRSASATSQRYDMSMLVDAKVH